MRRVKCEVTASKRLVYLSSVKLSLAHVIETGETTGLVVTKSVSQPRSLNNTWHLICLICSKSVIKATIHCFTLMCWTVSQLLCKCWELRNSLVSTPTHFFEIQVLFLSNPKFDITSELLFVLLGRFNDLGNRATKAGSLRFHFSVS